MAELFLGEAAGAHGFAKNVVIKRILPHLAADEQFTHMFISEAKLTARLTHPKIAQTFDLGIEDGQLFIAMELIDGIDVLAALRECAHRKVRLPAELSVFIVHEVLDALDFAHKQYGDDGKPLGVVHRDVSPSNVLLSRRGDVKLVDFGIAHAAQGGKTQSGALKGKYGYMSPEQVMGQPIDARSDIFSVGILLAEMLMGRRLFAAPNELDVLLMVRDVQLDRLEKFGKHVDPSLVTIIRWALRKDPNDRFPDAAAFRDHLDEWLFDNRHRVGNKNIAEVVDHLYEDAELRRTKMLKEIDAKESGADAPVEAPLRKVSEAKVALAAALDDEDDEEGDEPSIRIETPEGRDINADELSLSEADLDLELGASPPLESATGYIDRGEDSDIILVERPIDEVIDELVVEEIIVLDASKEKPRRDASEDVAEAMLPTSPQDFDAIHHKEQQEKSRSRRPSAEQVARAKIPEPPPLEDPEDTPARRGDLKDEPALSVLFRYTASRSTGMLDVSVGGIKKTIYFVEGIPEFVTSNISSELFGSYLVRKNVISSGELDMSLAMMPHFGGKLGDTLVGLDLMKPLDVFRHLTSQVRSKLIDLCTWSAGVYAWYPGRLNPREGFRLSIDPLEIYGSAAKELPDEFVMQWFRNHSSTRFKRERSAKIVPELFLVGPLLRSVGDDFNGERSLRQIVDCYSKNEECERLRMLFLLVQTGLARPTN